MKPSRGLEFVSGWRAGVVAVLGFAACLLTAAAPSPRETATVWLIRAVQPAVVPVYVQGESGVGSGTASIIHPGGFMLSNDHVSLGRAGVALFNGERRAFRVIGRLPDKDVALLQLQTDRAVPFIPLGRSHDLMPGEPTIAAGNPGGRGIVFTKGIVSAPSIMGGVNALIMSYFQSGRDEFIQFDAASNPGNSGGPLVNALGRQIGIVSSGVRDEENINYAIPVDRVRRLFAHLYPVEVLQDFWTGIEIDLLADGAVVKNVAVDSPAAKAGVKAGDRITSLKGYRLQSGIDWLLGLRGHSAGKSLRFCVAGKPEREVDFPLVRYPRPGTVSRKGLRSGIDYEVYHGKFKVLPDFAKLKPASRGTTAELKTESLVSGRKDYFALVFRGFLDVPKAGLYRFSLGSDDGSRLFLDGKPFIDNDDNHPMQRLSRTIRLDKGPVPFRLEYFDYTGDAELELTVVGGAFAEPVSVPAKWFLRAAD